MDPNRWIVQLGARGCGDSPRPVHVRSVIDSEYQYRIRLCYPIDDAVCTASRAEVSGKFEAQGLTNAVRVLEQGAGHELDDRSSSKLRESGESTLSIRSDPEFVGRHGLLLREVLGAKLGRSQVVAFGEVLLGSVDLFEGTRCGEQVKGLLECLEVTRTDKHSGGAAVARDDDALVVTLDKIDDLGEVSFDIRK